MREDNRKKAPVLILYAIVFLALLWTDLHTKQLALTHLKDQADVVLIPGALVLRYLENRGAAFGMLQDARIFFLVIGILFLGAAILFFYRTAASKGLVLMKICVLLIASGAAGNLADRLSRGYVVDFIYFSLINFPIFNVADCYVTIGTALLFIALIFVYREEDLKVIGFWTGPEKAVDEAADDPGDVSGETKGAADEEEVSDDAEGAADEEDISGET